MQLALKDANILLNIVSELGKIEGFQELVKLGFNEKKMVKFGEKYKKELQAMEISSMIGGIIQKHQGIIDQKSFKKVLLDLESYNILKFIDQFTYEYKNGEVVIGADGKEKSVADKIRTKLTKEVGANLKSIQAQIKDTQEFKDYFGGILEISVLKDKLETSDNLIESMVDIYRLELINKDILKNLQTNNLELYNNFMLYQASYEYMTNEDAMNSLVARKFAEDNLGKTRTINKSL